MINVNEEIKKVLDKINTYLELSHFKKAESLLQKAVDKFGQCALLLNMQGVLFHRQSRFSDAIEEFQKALKYDPSFTEAALNLAVCFADTSQYNSAAKIFSDLMKHQTSNELYGRETLLEDLAQKHAECGKLYCSIDAFEEAREAFHKALELNPKLPDVRLELAKILMKSKQIEKARLELEEIIKVYPEYSEAYITLGMLYFKTNKRFLARKLWQKAAQTDPSSSKAKAFLNLSSDWSLDENPPMSTSASLGLNPL